MKPIRTACLAVLPALLGFVPAVRDVLLYNRAAILQGEGWRLWTGHWIHFSSSHFFWNAAVLTAAGAWLERERPGAFAWFLLLAAPVVSLLLLVGAPAMATYGGLSGLATGVVVLLALVQQRRHPAARGWWLAALALVGIKLTLEATASAPLFATYGSEQVRTSALAHALGAAAAGLFFLSPLAGTPVGLTPSAAARPHP
jgi:rhomboid family GlyGly-CTERM serine protease